jgi:hypothetical protein
MPARSSKIGKCKAFDVGLANYCNATPRISTPAQWVIQYLKYVDAALVVFLEEVRRYREAPIPPQAVCFLDALDVAEGYLAQNLASQCPNSFPRIKSTT